MHLPVDLQLCGCSAGLLGGRIWPGKCPLLPYDPGLAVALRHSWKLGDPGNGLARVLIGTPDSPPSSGVEMVIAHYPSGLSIIPGTGEGVTQHHGMCMMSSRTLLDNTPTQVGHAALCKGGWVPLRNSRSLVRCPQC